MRIVAPLVGAWIEIYNHKKHNVVLFRSLLSWERGLKLLSHLQQGSFSLVAPLVGAWIEITLEDEPVIVADNGRSSRGSVD